MLVEVVIVFDDVAMDALRQRPLLFRVRHALAAINLQHDLIRRIRLIQHAHNEWWVHIAWVDRCVFAVLIDVDDVGVVWQLDLAALAFLLWTANRQHACCVIVSKEGCWPTAAWQDH